jgi:hypothetical protein
MLPLLPALILLFLQGPAGIERMAWNGQLPGALDALHRQISSAPEKSALAEEIVLASLLTASGDRQVSRALFQLLSFIEPTEERLQPAIIAYEASPPVFIPPPALGDLRDGFCDCRRSRDGPFAIA